MSNVYELAPEYPSKANFVLGIPVHPVGVQEVHGYIDSVIGQKKQALILNVNIHCVNLALENPWLFRLLRGAQLVFCDGDGVRWGLKLLRHPPPPKITYNQWMWQLAEHCEASQYSLFLIGGKPGIAAEAAEKLRAQFPRLKIVGTRDGYFQKKGEENESIIAEINSARPDILVTGFGMPVQEKWLEENSRRIKAHIFLTGGAVFDYVSGRLAKAPDWMVRRHLEWFFRLCQEPRRLFKRYALGNVLFFMRVFGEMFKKS